MDTELGQSKLAQRPSRAASQYNLDIVLVERLHDSREVH